MIDYLEALLEDMLEETEESLLPGRRVLMRTTSDAPSDETREDRGGEGWVSPERLLPQTAALARQTAWGEEIALSPQEPGEPEEGAREEAAPLPERLKRERRAAETAFLAETGRREQEGAALYETLRRAARTARTGREGTGTISLTLPNRAVPTPGLTLTDIDRAVQRDARRFDGGYTLY